MGIKFKWFRAQFSTRSSLSEHEQLTGRYCVKPDFTANNSKVTDPEINESAKVTKSEENRSTKSKTTLSKNAITETKYKSERSKTTSEASATNSSSSRTKSVDSKSKSADSKSKSADSKSKSADSKSKSADSKSKSADSKSKSADSESKSTDSKSKSAKLTSKSTESKLKPADSNSKSTDSKIKQTDFKNKSTKSKQKSTNFSSKSKDPKTKSVKSKTKSTESKNIRELKNKTADSTTLINEEKTTLAEEPNNFNLSQNRETNHVKRQDDCKEEISQSKQEIIKLDATSSSENATQKFVKATSKKDKQDNKEKKAKKLKNVKALLHNNQHTNSASKKSHVTDASVVEGKQSQSKATNKHENEEYQGIQIIIPKRDPKTTSEEPTAVSGLDYEECDI